MTVVRYGLVATLFFSCAGPPSNPPDASVDAKETSSNTAAASDASADVFACDGAVDCVGYFEDLLPCEQALCTEGGVCAKGPRDAGKSCDDGDGCTTNEVCQADGSCSVVGDGRGGTAQCLFNPDRVGPFVGTQVKNFELTSCDTECPFWFHQYCGTDLKFIWVVQLTAHKNACSYCRDYAESLEPMYQEFKDKGLEIVVLLGQDELGSPSINPTSCGNTKKKWKVSYPFFTDPHFSGSGFALPTFNGCISCKGCSCDFPRHYVVDAQTMEVWKKGEGVDSGVEEWIIGMMAD
jgi:glutathione peroxidase-family protein